MSTSLPDYRQALILPGIDAVTLEARTAVLMSRSFKTEAKKAAIDLAIGMIDLTSLEGNDTPGRITELANRAIRPDTQDLTCPSTAAICVFGDLAQGAKQILTGSTVRLAVVAGGFPHGRMSLSTKLADVTDALDAGADEIDMVIDRGAFLSGRLDSVARDIFETATLTHERGKILKVILETGELGDYENMNKAAWIAMHCGADFIKTSTGKISPAATPASTMVLLRAARDFSNQYGKNIGVKPAGGIRTTKAALGTIAMVNDVLGPVWLTPELFRFGASALLSDLILQRQKIATGNYSSPNYVAGATGTY